VIASDRALVDRFLDMLAAEAGASPNTLAAYRNDLEKAAEDLGGELGKAGRQSLGKLGQKWAGLAASTVARRSSALRRFYRFLVDDQLRADDPSSALPQPRLERPLPRVLGEEDVESMFEAVGEKAASGEPLAQRNLALLELLYGSGLRASEVIALPRGAVRPGQPLKRGSTTSRRRAPGCFPAARSTSAVFACFNWCAKWRQTQELRRNGSARTSFAMPSRHTCFREVPIFASCKRCSAMRISPRRRFTPMSTPRGWSSS
jgi:hypothetical protein